MDRVPAKRSVEYDNNSLKRARLGAKANQSRPRVGSSPLTSYAGSVSQGDGIGGYAATSRDSGHHATPEVAADFADSLQDLKMNNQYEISSLTIIARENAEHAMAISQVLENHITQTPPIRKLPALYVLDSIVKNVGGLYKTQLAHNLYSTFMDAYTLVDGQTRKSMEAMLKTWKEPIFGSMEVRPVFPIDTTRRIENALIKARTAFVQQQQQQSRTQRQFHPLPPRPAELQHSQNPPLSVGAYQYGYQSFAAPQQSAPQTNYQSAGPLYRLQSQTPIFNHSGGFQVPSTALSNQLATYQQPPTPMLNQFGEYQQQNHATVLHHFNCAPTPDPTPAPIPALISAPALTSDLAVLLSDLLPTMTPPVPLAPLPSTSTISSQAPMHMHSLSAPPAMSRNDVLLTTASLKTPRPDLLRPLFESQPSQCGTCGRRFLITNEGRARKGRHLDFHFRMNMRLADAARTGVSRSWFLDEMEWIMYREVDDADDAATAARAGISASDQWTDTGVRAQGAQGARGIETDIGDGVMMEKRQQYVKVPTDVGHQTCPICQEEFEKTFEWLDDTREQEWVWMGAVRHGEKVYHTTCMRDLTKDGGR